MAKFCGVNLPQTNIKLISDQIENLQSNQKQTLYFLYSEFLLRANRNVSYKDVLAAANITAIDGQGLEWTNQMLTRAAKRLSSNQLQTVIQFGFNLALNVFTGFLVIIFKVKLVDTSNQVILGRDFVYNLFDIATNKHWKIGVIGGSDQLESSLKNLQPNLDFKFWYREYDSELMQDKPKHTQIPHNNFDLVHSYLNPSNLYSKFPELEDAKEFLINNNFDLVLVCLGGASGKQEFFIKDIQNDQRVHFRLATGLGAGLDHLGSGAKQKRVPKWLEQFGLEAFYRVFSNPKRAMRIWDSLFTLWWWTSLQPFIKNDKQINLANLSDNNVD